MKGFNPRPSQCLHKIIRLAAHEKCIEKAMICSQNCQYKQSHLIKGDHPTIPIQQFVLKLKEKRAQIQKQGKKFIASIEQEYQEAITNLKKKKQECQQNIKQLIKISGYPDKYLIGLQKVQNQRYQSLLCKQVYELLKFQPLLTKKIFDAFQKNLREFQNCKFKNIKSDKKLMDFQDKDVTLQNKKEKKQEKISEKMSQKHDLIRQKPKINPPSYLLLQDKVYFQKLITQNQQLQIELRKAQNQIKKIKLQNNSENIQQHSSSQSDCVEQIRGEQINKQHNNYIQNMIKNYIDKQKQQNSQKKKEGQIESFKQSKDSSNYSKNSATKINKSIENQISQSKKNQNSKQIQYQDKPKFVGNLNQTVYDKKLQKKLQTPYKQDKNEQIKQNKQTQNMIKKSIEIKTPQKNNLVLNKSNCIQNSKEIIKQEYNESQQIYNYYDKQLKDKQKNYTSTQQLKRAGTSMQNIIKLQYTQPVPSHTLKYTLKQIPKLNYGKPKITTLNYAQKISSTNEKQKRENEKSSLRNDDSSFKNKNSLTSSNINKFANNQNIENIKNNTTLFSSNQNNIQKKQSQPLSFLNAPVNTFKPPPTMMLNDPTMKIPKLDISKIFQQQQQMKKQRQLKIIQEQKLRKETQQKQRQQQERLKQKQEELEKKKLQQAKLREQKDFEIIQSILKTQQVNNYNQINSSLNQLSKIKEKKDEEILKANLDKKQRKQGQKADNQLQKDMKNEQEREEGSVEMDIEQQSKNSNSFQI